MICFNFKLFPHRMVVGGLVNTMRKAEPCDLVLMKENQANWHPSQHRREEHRWEFRFHPPNGLGALQLLGYHYERPRIFSAIVCQHVWALDESQSVVGQNLRMSAVAFETNTHVQIGQDRLRGIGQALHQL